MGTEQFVTIIIGLVVSIIGYFLKSVIEEHKETQKIAIENKSKIELLTNDHQHLNEKFDSLLAVMRELTQEMKNLSKELSRKKTFKMKKFITGIFTDENGVWSSKRLIGIIGGLSLIAYQFIHPSDAANNSVLIMSLGALGITGFETIFKKEK